MDWDYDPAGSADPVPQNSLIHSLYLIKSTIAAVRVENYGNINYIKLNVRYRYPIGNWTAWIFEGTDYSADYYGDYKITWDLIGGTNLLQVQVTAYDFQNHPISIQIGEIPLDPSTGGGIIPL